MPLGCRAGGELGRDGAAAGLRLDDDGLAQARTELVAMARAIRSDVAPGPAGRMMETGLPGNAAVWAKATELASRPAATTASR